MISWTVVMGSPYSSEPREKTTSCCIGGSSFTGGRRGAERVDNRRPDGFALGAPTGGRGSRPDRGSRTLRARPRGAGSTGRSGAPARAVGVAHPHAVLRPDLLRGLVAGLREADCELRPAVGAAPRLPGRADALRRHVRAHRDGAQGALRGEVPDPLDRQPRRDRDAVDRLVRRAEQRVVDQVHVAEPLGAGAAVHLVEAGRRVALGALPARAFAMTHRHSDRPRRVIALVRRLPWPSAGGAAGPPAGSGWP